MYVYKNILVFPFIHRTMYQVTKTQTLRDYNVTKLKQDPVAVESMDRSHFVVIVHKLIKIIEQFTKDNPQGHPKSLMLDESILQKIKYSPMLIRLMAYKYTRADVLENIHQGIQNLLKLQFPTPLLNIIASYVQKSFLGDRIKRTNHPSNRGERQIVKIFRRNDNDYAHNEVSTWELTTCKQIDHIFPNDMFITPCCNTMICPVCFWYEARNDFTRNYIDEHRYDFYGMDEEEQMEVIHCKFLNLKWQEQYCICCQDH